MGIICVAFRWNISTNIGKAVLSSTKDVVHNPNKNNAVGYLRPNTYYTAKWRLYG